MLTYLVSIVLLLVSIQISLSSQLFSSIVLDNAPGPSMRSRIDSFKVMDVLARANELESENKTVYHMEVGQPSSGL